MDLPVPPLPGDVISAELCVTPPYVALVYHVTHDQPLAELGGPAVVGAQLDVQESKLSEKMVAPFTRTGHKIIRIRARKVLHKCTTGVMIIRMGLSLSCELLVVYACIS